VKNPFSMKRSCIVFNSFFLVVLLTCLFSCKSETLVETILEYQAGTDVSAPSKDLVVQQLKSRFSDGTYGEVIIEAVPQGVRVVTALEDTSLQSLRDLDVYFGSLEVGLYDAANLSDPEIESWLGQVELPEGIYQDIQRSLGLNQNILLQAQEGTDFDKLLNSLKATIPQEKDYIMFWSLPGKLYGYDGPNGRSLHLYRDTKSTGGPRLDNASIKSAKTVETEYGIDAIEAEFTAKGTIGSDSNTRRCRLDIWRWNRRQCAWGGLPPTSMGAPCCGT